MVIDDNLTLDDLYNLIGRKDATILNLTKQIVRLELRLLRAQGSDVAVAVQPKSGKREG